MGEWIAKFGLPLAFAISFWFILRATKNITKAYKQMIEIYKKMESISDRIGHLYTLTRILHNGLCDPLHKMIFAKIYETDPKKCPKNPYENFNVFKEVILENYQITLGKLEELKKQVKEEPKTIEKIDKYINEINNVVNLLSTIDEKSSKDHINNIMYEVSATMMKILRVNFDEV